MLPPTMICSRTTAVALALTAALAGCAVFEGDAVVRSSDTPLLPPLTASADAVKLELVHVERPVTDPLLGRTLWSQLDSLAGVPPDRRMALAENGFRYALCGSEPPETLAELLRCGMAEEYDDPAGFRTNRWLAMRHGTRTEVLCSIDPSDWEVDLVREGRAHPQSFPGARGFLSLEVTSVQEGWVEVRITPEIHYGAERVHYQDGEEGWSLGSGQRIETVPGTSFSVHMSLNDMLVLSAADLPGDRVGNRFFRREEDGRLMQRFIVLRAAAMRSERMLVSGS